MWIPEVMGCVCDKERLEIDDSSFRILKQLGEGGFSLIYLAEERSNGKKRLFAIKKMECHSKREVDRAKNEVGVHEKIGNHHPNVLGIETYKFGAVSHHQAVVYQGQGTFSDAANVVYMVLPYFKNGTLQEELERRAGQIDHIPEERVLRLFLGICEGIRAFHENNLTHRDVKPHNVLLSETDVPVLMDFGSAGPAVVEAANRKEAQAIQDEAAEHCSMPYRAPELFHVESGAVIDDRVDIWSLGCLLYAMCFFRSPFDEVYERGDSVALAVAAGNVKIPSQSKYSDEVHELIGSMLIVECDKRPRIQKLIRKVSFATGSAFAENAEIV